MGCQIERPDIAKHICKQFAKRLYCQSYLLMTDFYFRASCRSIPAKRLRTLTRGAKKDSKERRGITSGNFFMSDFQFRALCILRPAERLRALNWVAEKYNMDRKGITSEIRIQAQSVAGEVHDHYAQMVSMSDFDAVN